MSNCTQKIYFPVKLLKTVFVANNWLQTPGFDQLHHKCDKYITIITYNI